MKRSRIWVNGLGLLALCLGDRLIAQNLPPVPFTLDVAPNAGKPVALTMPARGELVLNLIRTGSTPAAGTKQLVNVTVSPFTNDQEGDSVPVDLLLGDGSKHAPYLNYDVSTVMVLPVTLRVATLPTASAYTGRLNITGEGFAPTGWDLSLKGPAPPPSTLVASRHEVTVQITRSPLCWLGKHLCGDSEPISVELSDKTGKHRVEGLSVSLESLTKASRSGFDLSRNVDFMLNGKPIHDFQSWPSVQAGESNERTIPVGGHASVVMTLKGLTAGEYDAVLRFQGTNSVADDAQKLALTISVRDSWVAALVPLLLALLMSFFGTKVLNAQRQRATFLGRIHELRRPWLRQEPPIMPVVWARAVLRQAESLSRKFWLTSPDLIDDRVNQVVGLLGVLEKVHQFRNNLSQAVMGDLIRTRAGYALNRIVGRLPAMALKDPEVTQITADLTALSPWLRADTRDTAYRAELQEAIRELLPNVRPGDFEGASVQELVRKLVDRIQQRQGILQSPPATITAAELNAEFDDLERAYDTLKILWERRSISEETSQLVALCEKTTDIQTFFRQADQQVWERVGKLGAEFRVHMPGEDSEAYDTLGFSVETGNQAIDQTYTFRHVFRYEWTFTLYPGTTTWAERLRLRRRPAKIVLSETSAGPSIVQFFPRPGLVEARVVVSYGSESEEVPSEERLRILPSSDFLAFHAFEKVEVVSWLLAAVAAIVTGLTTFYFNSSTFGAVKDYLALFAWGAGVDQGKNFLQQLQAYSRPAPGK